MMVVALLGCGVESNAPRAEGTSGIGDATPGVGSVASSDVCGSRSQHLLVEPQEREPNSSPEEAIAAFESANRATLDGATVVGKSIVREGHEVGAVVVEHAVAGGYFVGEAWWCRG
jgi:hypothetical protein